MKYPGLKAIGHSATKRKTMESTMRKTIPY